MKVSVLLFLVACAQLFTSSGSSVINEVHEDDPSGLLSLIHTGVGAAPRGAVPTKMPKQHIPITKQNFSLGNNKTTTKPVDFRNVAITFSEGRGGKFVGAFVSSVLSFSFYSFRHLTSPSIPSSVYIHPHSLIY
jgi:hypothetical protein